MQQYGTPKIRKVRELTGLPIHYFVTLYMEAFVNIIDILGGIEIDVPNVNRRGGMFYNDPTPGGARINLTAGRQLLLGEDALGFVRFRSYLDGDLGRIRAQQQFMTAMAEQHMTLQNLTNISAIFREINEHVRTNFSAGDLLRYAILLRNLNLDAIQPFQVPGFLGYVGQISYFIPNHRELESLVQEHFMLSLDEPYEEPIDEDVYE